EWNRWAAPSHSHLHRPAFDAHRGLAHGFAQCRMRVAGASDVLRGGTELDRERGFGNHVARLCAQDMHPKYAVALGVGDHLGEAVRRGESLGAGIGGKGELADLVGDAGRLEFFLRLADARNFRRGVDDSGDRIVVDVAGLARDPFGAGDGLVFRLVRQHRALAAIADRPDAGNIGGVVRVVTTRPRASSFTPVFSRPSLSTKGRRPMETSMISVSITCFSPPAAGSMVTERESSFFSTPTTLVESWNFMPWRVRIR